MSLILFLTGVVCIRAGIREWVAVMLAVELLIRLGIGG